MCFALFSFRWIRDVSSPWPACMLAILSKMHKAMSFDSPREVRDPIPQPRGMRGRALDTIRMRLLGEAHVKSRYFEARNSSRVLDSPIFVVLAPGLVV